MEHRRTLNIDEILGTQTDFVYESGDSLKDDQIIISESQDVTAIIEANNRSANEIDKHQKYGEWSKVASIPLNLYYDLKRQGIVDDPARFKKWLNDSDNRFFRTRGGRV